MTTLDSLYDGTGDAHGVHPIRAHNTFFERVEEGLDGAVGLGARFAFLAVLAMYYLNSALTKVGSGLPGALVPTDGAYVQILPHVMEQVGYDSTQIGFFGDLVVYAGTYAEFILPVLLVIGLFTRLAALGMIGFVFVQSAVDILYHGADETTIGALFDRVSDSAILDQRLLWVTLLAILIVKGGGWLSLDRLLRIR
ncbi:MAG: DoxX family protein [Pseudomonadota bacterium]